MRELVVTFDGEEVPHSVSALVIVPAGNHAKELIQGDFLSFVTVDINQLSDVKATEYGRRLGASLLPASVGAVVKEEVQTGGSLRIILRASRNSVVHRLALELIILPDTADFLLKTGDVSLVRQFLDTPTATTSPIRPEQPIGIVAVLASPEGLAELTFTEEREHLELFAAMNGTEAYFVEPQTLKACSSALDVKKPVIFHFSGHGESDPDAKVAFATHTGGAEFVPLEDLVPRLEKAGTQVVVINACLTGQNAKWLSHLLDSKRLYCAVAFHSRVSTAVAAIVLDHLSGCALESTPVDEAIRAARRSLWERSSELGAYSWANPVILARDLRAISLPIPHSPPDVSVELEISRIGDQLLSRRWVPFITASYGLTAMTLYWFAWKAFESDRLLSAFSTFSGGFAVLVAGLVGGYRSSQCLTIRGLIRARISSIVNDPLGTRLAKVGAVRLGYCAMDLELSILPAILRRARVLLERIASRLATIGKRL